MRNLLTLVHYTFGIFLRHKASEAGAIVLDVSEGLHNRDCLVDRGGAGAPWRNLGSSWPRR